MRKQLPIGLPKHLHILFAVLHDFVHCLAVKGSSSCPVIPSNRRLLVRQSKKLLHVSKTARNAHVRPDYPHSVDEEYWPQRTLVPLQEPSIQEFPIKKLAVVGDDNIR